MAKKFSSLFIAWRVGQSDRIQIPKSVYQAKQPISFSIFCLYALAWLQTALGWGPVAVHFRRRDGIPNARVHFHLVQNSDAHLLPARLTALSFRGHFFCTENCVEWLHLPKMQLNPKTRLQKRALTKPSPR